MSKDRVPKYSDDDLYDSQVFDHIKKKVEHKQNPTEITSTGISNIAKVIILSGIIFSALLFSGVLTGTSPFDNSDTNTGDQVPIINNNGQSSSSLGDLCIQHTSLGAHYHFDLTLLVDGDTIAIPQNVGIIGDCMRPMHTHDRTGHIHIELPSGYTGPNPNLGDFFSIWGVTFSETSLLDQEGVVELLINEIVFSGSYRDYQPKDGDQISISLN